MKILGNDVVSNEEFQEFKQTEIVRLDTAVEGNSVAVSNLQESVTADQKLLKETILAFRIYVFISAAFIGYLLARVQ